MVQKGAILAKFLIKGKGRWNSNVSNLFSIQHTKLTVTQSKQKTILLIMHLNGFGGMVVHLT
jgi:hypothetical protein